MQVFLPYPSFQQSVACLDKSRLGNQIWRECKTLISGGWSNHPVAKMWADYKPALALYALDGIHELVNRQDIQPNKAQELSTYFCQFCTHTSDELPPFIGNEDFHRSHRLNLLWKDPKWYSQFFDEPIPTSKPDYIWPSPQKIGSVTGPEQQTKTTT